MTPLGIVLFGPFSGAQFNPAVSLALSLRGEQRWRVSFAYVLAQLAAMGRLHCQRALRRDSDWFVPWERCFRRSGEESLTRLRGNFSRLARSG